MRRDAVALSNAAVNPHVGFTLGNPKAAELTRRREEALFRTFGVDSAFDCRALHHHGFLHHRCRGSRRELDLPADQIDAGDHLGDRMLHLNAGVHLQEEKLAAVRLVDELHRTGAAVALVVNQRKRRLTHGKADVLRQTGSRRLLDDFLVTTLHRAIALERGTPAPSPNPNTWTSTCRARET